MSKFSILCNLFILLTDPLLTNEANTGVHCSGNVVSAGVNFKNAEQEVHLPEAAYEEPVKTLKMTPESDYSHLNTVVVDVAEPCEASVFINSQQDKVIYRPSQEVINE